MLIERRDENNQRLIDINKPANNGFTPLIEAASNGRLEIINELLEFKDPMVNTDAATPKGITALYMAAQNGHAPIIKALLPRLSPEVLDLPIQASSKILLTHALSLSREQEVKNLFQEKGVAEDAVIDGFTPLHAAIFFGRTEVVKILIEAGCDINKTTQQGISAIDFARAMNQKDIIKELEQAHALQQFHNLPIDAKTKDQVLQMLNSRSLDIEVKTAALDGIIDETENKNDALTVAIHIVDALDNLKSPDLNNVENQVMIARAGNDAASIVTLLTQHPTKEDTLKNKPSESPYSLGGIYRTLKTTSANLPFFSPKKTVETKPTPTVTPPIAKPKSGH
jgi:ankyrin repeat protein